MRILVTGKNGQLGQSINKLINIETKIGNNPNSNEFIFVGRGELDLSSESSISHYFDSNDRFDVIINCAAYTAVDKAEEEQELVNQVNHLAVSQLAQIAKNQKAKLIHISTDYVFDGGSDKPYTETDKTNPINVYGKTKLAGEKALQEIMTTNAIIIRTSWLYSEYGKNFVKTMLNIGKNNGEISVVNDQIGSPTYALDLAQTVIHIISHEKFTKTTFKTQIYHYSNLGFYSWYEFAKEIFKISDIGCLVNPITTDKYPLPATRPMFTVLNSQKITDDFDLKIPERGKSINKCIKLLKIEY